MSSVSGMTGGRGTKSPSELRRGQSGRAVLRLGWTCGACRCRVRRHQGGEQMRKDGAWLSVMGQASRSQAGLWRRPLLLCPTPLRNVDVRTCSEVPGPLHPGPCSLEMER